MWRTMRFIGQDGSMGYRTGEIYRVYIDHGRKGVVVGGGPSRVPYSSVSALLDNWHDVQKCPVAPGYLGTEIV